jgi:programmed cell death 6-interacting protein
VLDHLVKVVLPQLLTDLSASTAAGYDMTESFLTAMRDFMLAEAQECYWQQAVLRAYSAPIRILIDGSGDVETTLTNRRGHVQERRHRQIVDEGGRLDPSQVLAASVNASQVSEYYKSALTAANGTNTPSAGFFPAVRPDSCIYNFG